MTTNRMLDTMNLNINNNTYFMFNKCNNRYNIFIVYHNKVLKGFSTTDFNKVVKYIEDKKKSYKNLK